MIPLFHLCSPFEEIHRHMGEESVGENIFFGLDNALQLLSIGVQTIWYKIGRPAVDGLLALEDLFLKVPIKRAWRFSISSLEKFLGLMGDNLVSLSCEHIERGLNDNDLRSGSDKGNVTEIFPHLRDLLKNLGQTVMGSDLPKSPDSWKEDMVR